MAGTPAFLSPPQNQQIKPGIVFFSIPKSLISIDISIYCSHAFCAEDQCPLSLNPNAIVVGGVYTPTAAEIRHRNKPNRLCRLKSEDSTTLHQIRKIKHITRDTYLKMIFCLFVMEVSVFVWHLTDKRCCTQSFTRYHMLCDLYKVIPCFAYLSAVACQ